MPQDAAVEKSLKLVMESSARCAGQLPNSGAGGMARNPRNQARKQCCYLSGTPLTGRGKAARTGTRWRCLGSCNEPLQGWALVWGMAGAENREMEGRWHQGRMMEPNEQMRPAPVPASDGPNHHCICVRLCPARLAQDYARDTMETGMGGVIAPCQSS